MPRYLIQASYTAAAAAAFARQPQDRGPGVRAIIERLGGTMESIDFSLGEYDVIVRASLPNETAAAALALAVNAPGHLKSYHTTTLLSEEQFRTAQQQAQGANYQPPSQG